MLSGLLFGLSDLLPLNEATYSPTRIERHRISAVARAAELEMPRQRPSAPDPDRGRIIPITSTAGRKTAA